MMRVVQPLAAVQPTDPLASLIGGLKSGAQFAGKQEQQEAQTRLLGEQAGEKQALAELHQSQQQQQASMLPFQQQLSQAQAEQAQARAAQARTQAMFTPQQAMQQAIAIEKFRNAGKLALADQKAKAETPFEKGRYERLNKDMGGINERAETANESLFLHHQLLDSLDHVATGPYAKRILWLSPQGQMLKALIDRNKLKLLQMVKIGRLNQREFDTITNAAGTESIEPSALRKIFKGQIHESKRALAKQHFYNHALTAGERNPDKIAEEWQNHATKMEKEQRKELQGMPAEKTVNIGGQNYTLEQLLQLRQQLQGQVGS